jgi:hypothetical protein
VATRGTKNTKEEITGSHPESLDCKPQGHPAPPVHPVHFVAMNQFNLL